MEKVFETSKKASKRPLGWALRLLRLLFNLALIGVVGALAVISGLYAYVVYIHEDQLEPTYPVDLVQNSFIYNIDGSQIGEFKAEENRRTVSEEDLGEYLPQAVVAVEDRRFYEHWGVDFAAISRAAWEDLWSLAVSQGGSTITEQLMKNLYISEERRGNISPWRRLEQATLSFAYERRHTKEEILTAYLNTVYFGDGAYGAEEAAETYFGKNAEDLDLAEAAALAGFLHAPSTYLSKDGEGTELAIERRNDVLERMVEQGMISEEELDEADDVPLEFASDPPSEDPAYEPFKEVVRREVDRELGSEALEHGGLQIYTTLDSNLQQEAVGSVENTLDFSDDPSGAVVSVKPQDGAIRALAGQEKDFNLALDARRQPGSAFKPFVLATALREFVSPENTYYVSRNLSLDFGGERYEVQNYDGIERGRITLSQAMAESDNTVYVQLALDLGLNNVVETANAMGVTAPVDPYPAAAIGGLGAGVSALEMASAYATFAASGIHREPYAVERVERLSFGESESVYDHKVEGRRVLSGNQAAAANEVLRRVVQSGTATLYHNLDREIGHPSAGKTGTSDDFVDAWYVGYTPRLSTAVWVGYPEAHRPMLDVHGESVVNGETLPMDIWSTYMSEATEGSPVFDFPRPDRREFIPLNRGYAANPAPARAEGVLTPIVPARERLAAPG